MKHGSEYGAISISDTCIHHTEQILQIDVNRDFESMMKNFLDGTCSKLY